MKSAMGKVNLAGSGRLLQPAIAWGSDLDSFRTQTSNPMSLGC